MKETGRRIRLRSFRISLFAEEKRTRSIYDWRGMKCDFIQCACMCVTVGAGLRCAELQVQSFEWRKKKERKRA